MWSKKLRLEHVAALWCGDFFVRDAKSCFLGLKIGKNGGNARGIVCLDLVDHSPRLGLGIYSAGENANQGLAGNLLRLRFVALIRYRCDVRGLFATFPAKIQMS
jgi:hypothetical protein